MRAMRAEEFRGYEGLKLVDLFVRMDTRKAEVAATVDFAARELAERTGRKPSEIDVFGDVMKWKQRRRPALKWHDVALSIRNLNALGWLEVDPSHDLIPDDDTLQEA